MTYSLSDNLEYGDRQTYEYHPYLGPDFLKDFISSRSDFLNQYNPEMCIRNFDELASSLLKMYCREGQSEGTLVVLIKIIEELNQGSLSKNSFCIIMDFLKKFEVSRKIYSIYDSDFRPDKASIFSDEKNYGLLSIILNKIYQKDNNFQCFSTSLKINDVIVSNNLGTTRSDFVGAICATAISYEISVMRILCEKKNVNL
jgi:hypothetical protein